MIQNENQECFDCLIYLFKNWLLVFFFFFVYLSVIQTSAIRFPNHASKKRKEKWHSIFIINSPVRFSSQRARVDKSQFWPRNFWKNEVFYFMHFTFTWWSQYVIVTKTMFRHLFACSLLPWKHRQMRCLCYFA